VQQGIAPRLPGSAMRRLQPPPPAGQPHQSPVSSPFSQLRSRLGPDTGSPSLSLQTPPVPSPGSQATLRLALPPPDVSHASSLGQKVWSRGHIRPEGVTKTTSPSLRPSTYCPHCIKVKVRTPTNAKPRRKAGI